MELTINGKTVILTTGTRFLKELDKVYQLEVEGGYVDFGLNQLFVNFAMRSVSALSLAIYAASRTNKNFKPTYDQIDEFLDQEEDIEWLFEAFEEQLRESNRTKKDWNALENNLPNESE
jgi:hypothetical protein